MTSFLETRPSVTAWRISVLNLPVRKTITVKKEIGPADRPEKFDLLIDGAVWRQDAGNGEGTDPMPVSAGTYSVSETNADSTQASSSLWQSDISCEDMVGRCSNDPTKHCVTDTICGTWRPCLDSDTGVKLYGLYDTQP